MLYQTGCVRRMADAEEYVRLLAEVSMTPADLLSYDGKTLVQCGAEALAGNYVLSNSQIMQLAAMLLPAGERAERAICWKCSVVKMLCFPTCRLSFIQNWSLRRHLHRSSGM